MKDKVVIITGGSSGIGKATARRFPEKGSKVIINGRNNEKLLKVVQEFKSLGLEVHGIAGDVSNENVSNENNVSNFLGE